MSPKFRPPVWLWMVLAATTAVSAWVGVQRHREETAHRAVHLVADIADIRQLSAVSGVPVKQVLASLQGSGLTGVAIAEETFDDLVALGKVVARPELPGLFVCGDSDTFNRLRAVFKARFRPVSGPTGASLQGPSGEQFPLPGRSSDLKGFGLGLDKAICGEVVSTGLTLVARLSNPPAATQAAIDDMVTGAKLCGAQGVIVGGDQMIGRRDLIQFAADDMKANGLWFGMVEFTNQGGAQRMLKEMLSQTLRVHSMVAAEIDRSEPPEIVDRYVRAVVERNVKVCFLRPVSWAANDPLDGFRQTVAAVAGGLHKQGFEAKTANPAYPTNRPAWAGLIVALGIALSAAWLAGRFLRGAAAATLFIAFVGLAVGAYFGATTKYVGLLGALTFPTWAMLAAFAADNAGGSARKWACAFFWITLLSVVGGIHVAALLTELPYMLRLEQFFGVKVAHFLPPLLVAFYLVNEQVRLRDALDRSVKWLDIALLGLFAAALLFMLVRTGNDAPGDVSSLELKMRSILDRLLPERPRTKEFLIGHPALVLALWMAFRDKRRFLPLVGLMAAIGQASVLNTFCHLHTPIAVSAMRVVTGVLVGGAIGLAVLGVYRWVSRRGEAA